MDNRDPAPALREISRGGEAWRFIMGDSDEAVYFFADAIEDCNDATCRLFGRPREALIGHTPLEFSPEFQADGSRSEVSGAERFERAFAGQAQWFRWLYLKADGTASPAMIHVELVRVDGRRRLLVRARDLLELERPEHAIAETEVRFQQILDHTPVIAFAKDLAGRHVFVNREFERLAGSSREQMLGRTDLEIFSPAIAESLKRNDARVLAEARAIEFEETVRFGSAEHTYLSIKFPIFDRAGEVAAVGGISTDITERKRAGDALRQAALAVSAAQGERVFEALARSLAAVASVDVAFIAVHDEVRPGRMRTLALVVDGEVLPNRGYAIAGTPCAEVHGRKFLLIASGIDKRYSGEPLLPGLHTTGYAGYPMLDSAGRSLGLIALLSREPLENAGTIESMTRIFAARAAAEIERARAEQAQRESEAGHRAIFESAEDAIFVHDYDTGAILDANPKACSAYGYTREEFTSIDLAELGSGVPPYTSAQGARWIARAKSRGTQRFEWHRRNKDGSLHWDEVVLKPVDIAGRLRILAFTREITARKAAEDNLRASEEQYRAVFNAAEDGIALWDAEGRIVDVNPAYAAMVRGTREALLGSEGAQLLPDETRKLCGDMLADILAGKPCGVEATARRLDASTFDAEIHGVLTPYQNRPHVLVTVRDLTERRLAEAERADLAAQLRQAQKMEALGHLAGGIAHDFNNILASIMGNLVLAADREAVAGDARLARYLDQALASSKKARDLIAQMITYSRGRRGEPRPVSLAQLIEAATPLLRSSLPATVRLLSDAASELPAANLDPVQVEQVLLNLCINARDAMQSNGAIHVSVAKRDALAATCASCRQKFSGDFLELAVSDTGPGIPSQVLERIFEPFFTTKPPGKGSGMGLSTVHGIVHEHAGHLVVESSADRGARFRVFFPPAAAAGKSGAGPLPVAAKRRLPHAVLSGHVLLVDDEETVVEVLRDLLAGWGLAVTAVSNPRHALALFESEPARFDLILTDQTMPHVTGIELARVASTIRPEIPIVLCTGFGAGIPEGALATARVSALVSKPVEPARLLAVLESALSREIPREGLEN